MGRRWILFLGIAGILVILGYAGFHKWSVWSSFRRAEQACANRNWSLAIKILGPFLERYPDDLQAHLVMARAQFGNGDWREGLRHLDQIPDGSPLLAEAKFYEGSAMLEQDRAAHAERALRSCLSLDSQSIPARQQLMMLLLWEDRRAEARRLAWEVYGLAPPEHRAEALGHLFRVDYGEFPVEERRARLERFVALNPRDWNAMAALANLYSSDADPMMRERAKLMFREVLEQQPENLTCRIALITIAISEDQQQARQLLDTWPADLRDEQFLIAQGTLQQECDLDFARAAETFRRVLATQPDNWKVRGRLAVCLRMLGQPEKAELQTARRSRVSEALKEEKIRPLLDAEFKQLESVEYLYRLGQLYETVGRFNEARCWYHEALRVRPMHEPSKDAIERLKDAPDVQPVEES